MGLHGEMLISDQVKLCCCGGLNCTGILGWEGPLAQEHKWRSGMYGDIWVCNMGIEGDV